MNSTEPTVPRGMTPRTKNILVIAGVAGAIIIGMLLIYGVLVTPSRQPYRDALAQFENVGRANSRLTATGGSLNASKATGEDFKKGIEASQAALKSLKAENEALGKKVVLKEGEGKVLFDAYDKKLQEYMMYNENILSSMLKVRPVLFECNNDMTDITVSAESIAALRGCAHNLGSLNDVADADYRTLVTSFQQQYDELANVLEQMAALPDPEGTNKTQNSTLAGQRDELIEQLSATSTQFSKDLQKSRNQILTTTTEKKLSDYLKAKSRIF